MFRKGMRRSSKETSGSLCLVLAAKHEQEDASRPIEIERRSGAQVLARGCAGGAAAATTAPRRRRSPPDSLGW